MAETMVIFELEEAEGTQNSHSTSIFYRPFFLSPIISYTTLALSQEFIWGSKNYGNKLYITIIEL